MNTLLHWLTSPEWALVVKALLHSLWQGALIAAGLALLLRNVHRPTLRYRLALAGLASVMALAVVTWAVLNTPKTAPSRITAAPPPGVEPVPALTGPVQRIIVAADRETAGLPIQWTAWLALVWLAGASAMLGRASVKIAGAEQLRRSCRSLNDAHISALVAEARRAVKLTRQIRIAVTNQLTSPAVVGVLVPTLILPLSLITTLTHEQLRFILLHELAHIRRGDYLANLFQLFAEALLFFNPAVWWLSHQIRREREACCDALAIELSGAPADYARTLVSVAETMVNPSPAAAPAFGNGRESSSLADRVQRLLVPGYRPSLRLTWRAMLGSLVAGGALLGLLAVGTRETVAATTGLLAAGNDKDESAQALPALQSSNSTNLHNRVFKISGPELAQLTGNKGPLTETNSLESVRAFFAQAGVDMEAPGRAIFFKPTAGMLFVRATLAELEKIEGMLAGKTQHATSKPTNTESSSEPANNSHSPTNLVSRTFKVDPNSFVTGLENVSGLKTTNLQERIRAFFASVGVDLQPPKAVFFNDRQGGLFVRASLADLDIIEQAIQVLNAQPPQVNIQAKFVEVPTGKGDFVLGSLGPLASSNLVSAASPGGKVLQSSNSFAGILTDAQARVVFRALEQMKGVDILAAPEVTTVSGRQAQIQLVEIRTIVTGASPMLTNGVITNVFQTSPLPFGPTLDVIPYVAADGYTVQMTLIPTITEFLGYDRPEDALMDFARTNSLNTALPLPRFRVRQLTTSAQVWDGQTIVLGGFLSETVTRHPDGSETRTPDTQAEKKQLLVFITPTIVDSAGNRIQREEEKVRDWPKAPSKLPPDWK